MLEMLDAEVVAFRRDLQGIVALVAQQDYAAAREGLTHLMPSLNAEREDFKAAFIKQAPTVALKVCAVSGQDKECSGLARDLFLTAVECFKALAGNDGVSGFYGAHLLESGLSLFQALASEDGPSAVRLFSSLIDVGTTIGETRRVFDTGCNSLPRVATGKGYDKSLPALATSLHSLAGQDANKLAFLADRIHQAVPSAIANGKQEILDVILHVAPAIKQAGLGFGPINDHVFPRG